MIFCKSVLLVSCFMELWLRYKLVAVCYWSMTADFYYFDKVLTKLNPTVNGVSNCPKKLTMTTNTH